jgi:small subunit ribosomal protein S15
MSSSSDYVSNKKKALQTFGRHTKDTGSPEVQIAIFTKKLEQYASHFEKNPKDNHSRRGMFRIISKRKGLLEYLKGNDIEKYRATIASLGLRK